MIADKRVRSVVVPFGCVFCFAIGVTSASALAQEKMYFTSIGVIHRADLDGSNLETIYSQPSTAPWAPVLDLEARMIYWSDPATLEIRRSTLLGQNVEVLVTGIRSWGLSLDPANGVMYWNSDVEYSFAPGVYRSAMDGSNPELVFSMPGLGFRADALDTINGKIYWTADVAGGYSIWRADIDGTNTQELVEVLNGHDAMALALDVRDNRMYWSERDGFTGLTGGSISRSRLDGSQMEVVFAPEKAVGLALDLPRGHIYWTSNDGSIRRANLDGSAIVVMDLGIQEPRSIAIDTRPAVKVPAASAWGLVALSLAIASAGTVLLRRQRRRACHAT